MFARNYHSDFQVICSSSDEHGLKTAELATITDSRGNIRFIEAQTTKDGVTFNNTYDANSDHSDDNSDDSSEEAEDTEEVDTSFENAQPGPSTSRKYRKAVMRDTSSDSSSDDNYEPPTTSKARKIKPVSKSSAKSKVWFLTMH